uniref:LisH domain-containing protein n=1 Tax=Chlamydomonas chlamydogama TaxID=225041 RepID=A0A7S2QUJ5_9CHLO|mmetsp:Transcript_848/g.1900  ORF Transcript_848/g.1900 Transcript_848/m.1900 type:complete len:693 (+) Transcript_848:3-2081(+)
MIRQGLLEWVLVFMQDLDSLSEFTIEYGCALMMNLSLRSAGRTVACRFHTQLLTLCEALIESKNEQIRTYVNGTLYSVFERGVMREAARQRGYPDMLAAVSSTAPEIFAGQIEYIMRQLDTDNSGCGEGDGGESEDAAGEDGDLYYDDDDAMVDVQLADESSAHVPGAVQGEALLCSAYLAATDDAVQQADMMRASLAGTAKSGLVVMDTRSSLGNTSVLTGSVIFSTAASMALPNGSMQLPGNSLAAPLNRPTTPSRLSQTLEKQQQLLNGSINSQLDQSVNGSVLGSMNGSMNGSALGSLGRSQGPGARTHPNGARPSRLSVATSAAAAAKAESTEDARGSGARMSREALSPVYSSDPDWSRGSVAASGAVLPRSSQAQALPAADARPGSSGSASGGAQRPASSSAMIDPRPPSSGRLDPVSPTPGGLDSRPPTSGGLDPRAPTLGQRLSEVGLDVRPSSSAGPLPEGPAADGNTLDARPGTGLSGQISGVRVSPPPPLSQQGSLGRRSSTSVGGSTDRLSTPLMKQPSVEHPGGGQLGTSGSLRPGTGQQQAQAPDSGSGSPPCSPLGSPGAVGTTPPSPPSARNSGVLPSPAASLSARRGSEMMNSNGSPLPAARQSSASPSSTGAQSPGMSPAGSRVGTPGPAQAVAGGSVPVSPAGPPSRSSSLGGRADRTPSGDRLRTRMAPMKQ